WIQFLHHDTSVFTGAEKISRKIHAAAYYLEMRRPERNKYVGRFVKITPDVASTPTDQTTDQYFSMLETSIRKNPPFWLWTHNRWRHKRPQ
ncbi:MAG: acetyltransferase, partial [Muribaculaceae bacterium]|nr:acetyltransferase [Muribaculaceae bacterium]